MLIWKECYATGEAQIDAQHKELFDFVNKLETHVRDGLGPTYLPLALKFFENYAKGHFSYEEGCMHRYKCPVAEKNKASHQWFLEMFEGYLERFEKEGYSENLLLSLQRTAEEWLKTHIVGIDTHLRECIHKV